MRIGDLFFAFRGESRQLELDAKLAGNRAGKTMGQRIKSQLTAANIGAGIGAAAGAVGVAMLKMGDDYKQALDSIRIGTGATGDALKDLEGSFKRVAGQVPEDIGLVAEVIADLNTRTGQTGEGLETLGKQIIDLSRLTKTEATSNVALATRLFGDWSVATGEQAETLDKLFRASQSAGIGVDKLMEQVVSFGAPLRSIGFEFEDSIALLSKWEKEGVNVQLSLGGLKIALGEMAKEGIDAKAGLKDLVDQIIAFGPGAEAMALGAKKFGSRAGPDMVAAILEGRFAIDDYVDAIENGSDSIAQATKDTEDLGDGFRKLKNKVAVALGPITKDLAGISSSLGNAIFLLPALTGIIGRGIGSALTSSGITGALRGVGKSWGKTLGVAALAVVVVILAAELKKTLDKIRAEEASIEASRATIKGGGFGTDELQTQLKNLRAERARLESEGNVVLAVNLGGVADEFDRNEALLVAQIRRQYQRAAQEARAGSRDVADVAEQGSEEIGAAMTEGVERSGVPLGEALNGLVSGAMTALVQSAAAGAQKLTRLNEAMELVANGGLKALKREGKDADKAWKNIIGGGDRNRARLREVRGELETWEKRRRRALRENDSEGLAFAKRQIARLEAERLKRRAVIDELKRQTSKTKGLGGALDDLPSTVPVRVEMEFLKTGAVRIGKQVFGAIGGRATGGPVEEGVPYWVGENRRRELFVPDKSGRIVTEDAVRSAAPVGGDTINLTANVEGLPMHADTPREVAQQLRRAARMGVVTPLRRREFEPA